MNEYIDSRELQQMKEQLAILTQKLDKETIVNERLMRRAMKEKAGYIRRLAIIESIIITLSIPYFIWIIPNAQGMSVGFCGFTCLFLILALVYNYYIHRNFCPQDFTQGNLLDARKKTLRLKQLYANWLKFISIPFLFVWIGWLMYEMSFRYHGETLQAMMAGVIAGMVIGGIIGIKQYNKVQRTADEILEQIEEMQCNQ